MPKLLRFKVTAGELCGNCVFVEASSLPILFPFRGGRAVVSRHHMWLAVYLSLPSDTPTYISPSLPILDFSGIV
jgi:hypothetical protein